MTLKSLQAGRGLAASAVAAYHLTVTMPGQPFAWLTSHGNLGVDFFFVLSGFIILHAHQADIGVRSAWWVYVRKRFIRVFPLYWLVTIIFIVGSAVGLGEKSPPVTLADWATTFSLIRFSSFLTPLPPAWTLFHEIAFYGLFSVLILSRRAGWALISVWTLAMLGLFFYPTHEHPTFVGTILGAYDLNFIFGMSAFLLSPKLSRRAAWAVTLAGLALFAALLWAGDTEFWCDALRPGYGLALAAAIAGVVRLEACSAPWRLPILLLLGDASYSIYLLHESLESRLLRLATRLFGTNGSVPLTYVLVLGGALALGCLAHAIVEKPLLTGGRKLLFAGGRKQRESTA